MGKPFSDILEAERLYKEYQNYKDYKDNQGQEGYTNVGTQGKRGATKTVYVYPFSFDIPPNSLVSVKTQPDAWTALNALINAEAGIAVSDALNSNTGIELPGFTPAKIVWFRNTTYSTQTPTSKYTKRKYLKYIGTRSTLPFGRTDDTSLTEERDGFTDVKNTIKADNSFVNGFNRVNWIREKIKL